MQKIQIIKTICAILIMRKKIKKYERIEKKE
jgi:hypothetical protein